MQPNTRIAVNTSIIYIRLLMTIFVSLFSTRYVLLALGETNFGIYNLIAGIVALFAFISSTMAGTTQRYISFSMGQKDLLRVCNVFYNSRVIHLIIAVLVALLVETIGIYFVCNVVDIPIDKLDDAKFVLHCVCIGLIFTIITVPYEATLMAHENIFFVSLITIFNSIIKLGGAIVLLYVSANRLRLYAILMALLPFICLTLQYAYCKLKYDEIKNHRGSLDWSLIKEMSGYAGWVVIGVTCGTFRTQGTAMLLNVFFGVIANAANGIAVQVNGVLQQFSASITTSIRPQLVKSAGEGNHNRMLTLTYAACKYPLLLLILFATPLIIAMPYVLNIWLKEVPEHTVIFCQLILVSTIFNQASMGLTTAIEATGKVKVLHLVTGFVHIACLPVAYVLYKIGFPIQTIFWCIVLDSVISSLFRLILAKHLVQLSIQRYVTSVLLRAIPIVIAEFVCGLMLWRILEHNIIGLVTMCVMCAFVFCVMLYSFGLQDNERVLLRSFIDKGYMKIKSFR